MLAHHGDLPLVTSAPSPADQTTEMEMGEARRAFSLRFLWQRAVPFAKVLLYVTWCAGFQQLLGLSTGNMIECQNLS